MCNTSAHLTDRVFPDAPIRQRVLSVPSELLLLLRAHALGARLAFGRLSLASLEKAGYELHSCARQ